MKANLNAINYVDLESKLGYTFKNKDYLYEALIHSSYAHESGIGRSNERMELLGDAVLHFVLTEFLMSSFPTDNEGQLSALRSYCESEPFLYEHALSLDIGDFILFGKGEELSGGAKKESLLANTFEAIIAAIHMDGGYDEARQFIMGTLRADILAAHTGKLHIDSKSELQKITQKEYRTLPEYTVVSETGMDHNKTFGVQVEVHAPEKVFKAIGYGRNKKAAEKEAARALLHEIG